MWIPAVYTSPAQYLLAHPHTLGPLRAGAILAAGALSVYLNFDSDRMRQVVRAADGRAKVWGRPAEVIRAKYMTASGELKESILLVCGWWGLVRHFNYVPELLAAFLWTAPCGFAHFLPYFYTCPFLTTLLFDRARRDDTRCLSKYGAYWEEYRRRVPYKIIPYVF